MSFYSRTARRHSEHEPLIRGLLEGSQRIQERIAERMPDDQALQPLGNDGLWLAFLLFLASRGIGMHIGYRRNVLPAL